MKTLRVLDAQRIVSRARSGRAINDLLLCEIKRLIDKPGVDLATELDRMAGRFGARTLLLTAVDQRQSSGEYRPKDTDEVAPQSDDPGDGALHGGDGASQEVPDGVAQGGDKQNMQAPQSSGQPAQSGTGTGNGNGNGNKEMMAAAAANNPADGDNDPGPETADDGTSGEEKASTETGTTPCGGTALPAQHPAAAAAAKRAARDAGQNDTAGSSDHADKSDALTSGANDEMRISPDAGPSSPAKNAGVMDTITENVSYRSLKSCGTRQVSREPNTKFGGITAELKRQQIPPTLVKRARAALCRLIDGGESQSGPRFDYQKFAERLLTVRPLQPARREEEGRPAILVLADVSGSCSGFSDISLTVAQAVAMNGIAGADIIVISHSNGYPVSIMVNRRDPESAEYIHGGSGAALEWYDETLSRYDVRAVVAMGDWDAVWLYTKLASLHRVAKLVWLDNWSCNYLARPEERPDEIKHARFGRHIRKVTYVVGCGSAEDFIIGAKMSLK